jgi:hypothetical protein
MDLVRAEVESGGGLDAQFLEVMEVLPLPTTEVYTLSLTWASEKGVRLISSMTGSCWERLYVGDRVACFEAFSIRRI